METTTRNGMMKMIDYVKKPSIIKSKSSAAHDFSLCPSDYRVFEYGYSGKRVDELLDKKKVGQEIGSQAYIKNTIYKFLKTRNITSSNYLIDKQFSETCGNVDSTKPLPNSIFIAKDGGGNGLGEVALYDLEQYDNTNIILY